MQNLQELNTRLQRDYPRYRARWSDMSNSIKIEVKMGTGYWDVNPALYKGNPDMLTQIKDGFIEWGELTTGDRARCAHCTNTVKVPVNEFKEVKCNWCDMSQPARAFFPCNEDFIYHLNKLTRNRVSISNLQAEERGKFDTSCDIALDNALYNARENSWRLNNGVMAAVPSNFRKVV